MRATGGGVTVLVRKSCGLVNITLQQLPSLLQRTAYALTLGPGKVRNHLRQQGDGDIKEASALLPLGRSPGSQVGCPQESGGYGSFCSYHFSPFKKSTPFPGSSIPGSLRVTFSLLQLSLGRSSPAWSPICGKTKLGFAYVLEKPWAGSYRRSI